MFYQDPEDNTISNTPLDHWHITSLVISSKSVNVKGEIDAPSREGFYALKLDLTKTCLRDLKTFMVKSICNITILEHTKWGISNVGLVDEDYPKTEVAFGTYLPFDFSAHEIAKAQFDFTFLIGDYKNFSASNNNCWPATDTNLFSTPCYNVGAVKRKYQFKGLWLGSKDANAMDLMIENLDDVTIPPCGNVLIPFFESIPTTLNLLCGTFILRSRFMRKGIILVTNPTQRCFWLMNTSTRHSVILSERTFQYLPLGTTNLSKFADFEMGEEIVKGKKMLRRWSTPDKYIIVVNNKERKSKFSN